MYVCMYVYMSVYITLLIFVYVAPPSIVSTILTQGSGALCAVHFLFVAGI